MANRYLMRMMACSHPRLGRVGDRQGPELPSWKIERYGMVFNQKFRGSSPVDLQL
jgi:hypothetical protein